jgi:hypothetical protein
MRVWRNFGIVLLLVLGLTSVAVAQGTTTISTVYDVIELRSNGTTVAELVTVTLNTGGAVRPACAIVAEGAQIQPMQNVPISTGTFDARTRSLRLADGAGVTMAASSAYDLVAPESAIVLPIGFVGQVTLAGGQTADLFTGMLQLEQDTPAVCGMQLPDGTYSLISQSPFSLYGAVSSTATTGGANLTFDALYGEFDATYVADAGAYRFRLGDIPRPEGIDTFLIPLDGMLATAVAMVSDFGAPMVAQNGAVVALGEGAANGAGNGTGSGTGNGTGNGTSDGNGGGLIDIDIDLGNGTGACGDGETGSLLDLGATANTAEGPLLDVCLSAANLIALDASVGDANGDGVLDVDLNGDGLVDVDLNGDGLIDVDLNGDGLVDVDLNGDGLIDVDLNGDGLLDVDLNGDGVLDVDLDGDGDVDGGDSLFALDLDADVSDFNGTLLATNVALDVAESEMFLVSAIVDLNGDGIDDNTGLDLAAGVDVNGDGLVDVDLNGDGVIDVDLNGDGLIDVVVAGGSGGGVNVGASVGGSGGIDVNASVGGSDGGGIDVNASVGGSDGGGIDVNANVGGSSDGGGINVDANVGGDGGIDVDLNLGGDGGGDSNNNDSNNDSGGGLIDLDLDDDDGDGIGLGLNLGG